MDGIITSFCLGGMHAGCASSTSRAAVSHTLPTSSGHTACSGASHRASHGPEVSQPENARPSDLQPARMGHAIRLNYISISNRMACPMRQGCPLHPQWSLASVRAMRHIGSFRASSDTPMRGVNLCQTAPFLRKRCITRRTTWCPSSWLHARAPYCGHPVRA